MSKVETPVSGGGDGKGRPDGVSGAPAGGEVGGRTAGGESVGTDARYEREQESPGSG